MCGACCWHQPHRVLSRPLARQHTTELVSTAHTNPWLIIILCQKCRITLIINTYEKDNILLTNAIRYLFPIHYVQVSTARSQNTSTDGSGTRYISPITIMLLVLNTYLFKKISIPFHRLRGVISQFNKHLKATFLWCVYIYLQLCWSAMGIDWVPISVKTVHRESETWCCFLHCDYKCLWLYQVYESWSFVVSYTTLNGQ